MSKIVVTQFPEPLLAFVDKARGETSRSDFVRQAAGAYAAVILGEQAPSASLPRGRISPVKAAAEAAGMSVKDFIRKAAVEAAGGTYTPRAPKAEAQAAE